MPDCFLPETDQLPGRTRLNLRAWCDASWIAHSMNSYSKNDPRGATGRPGAFQLPKARLRSACGCSQRPSFHAVLMQCPSSQEPTRDAHRIACHAACMLQEVPRSRTLSDPSSMRTGLLRGHQSSTRPVSRSYTVPSSGTSTAGPPSPVRAARVRLRINLIPVAAAGPACLRGWCS